MFANALLTLYRSLTRHRLYAALNVFGLAVGVAVFLVLTLDVRFETGFERWIPDAAQIYTMDSRFIGPGATGAPRHFASMGALLDELRGEFPQLVGTRIQGASGAVIQGGHVTAAPVSKVDPSFFQVFDLPLVEGNRATALSSLNDLVLDRKAARTYFGAADPLGRTLTLSYGGERHVQKVTGVIADPPANTDLALQFIVPLDAPAAAKTPMWSTWGDNQLATYLRFATPAQAQALDANLDAFTDRHGVRDLGATPPPHEILRLRTFPLLGVHLSNPKDAVVIAGLGAVGLLTLILAAVNFVNLATATAGLRAREVAVRKVMGATQKALMVHFIGEAMLTATLGGLIGLALCELALPLINAAGGLSLGISYFGGDSVLLILVLIIVVVGFGAGIYPALVLSRFQPAPVLASTRTPGGGRTGARVREGLVVVQFAIAIALMVATGVILAQTRFVRQADLGFGRHGLIMVSSIARPEANEAVRQNLLAAWRALPGVNSTTMADIGPGDDAIDSYSNVKRPGDQGLGPSIGHVGVGSDFFPTYRARLLAGRLPDRGHGGDFLTNGGDLPGAETKVGPVENVVLNAAAVQALGFADAQAAIGQPLLYNLTPGVFQPMTVIGVVGDIRFRSPRAPVPPTVYTSYIGDFPVTSAAVRYTGDPREVMQEVAAAWRSVLPAVPFSGRTSEDSLDRYYRPDDEHGGLFSAGAVLAVLIGCVGLYGLASFTTARRTKEIGIRKTLGASTGDVLRLLVGQFLRPVLVANLIAWPLAWLAMRSYLSGFDQRVALSPLYFLAATTLALAIAALTVVGHALRVAQAEPARALRYE